MKLNKKAQGLSLNTIIIAILVIIVLIVIVFIFMGGMRNTSKSIVSCTEKGGECEFSVVGCYDTDGKLLTTANCKCTKPNSVIIPGTDCPNKELCCQQLYS